MLARGVLCRLAAPKTTTHDLQQLSGLVQRSIATHNAVSPASIAALSRSFKLVLSISQRGYATAAATKPTEKVRKDVKKAAAKKTTTTPKKTAKRAKAAPKKKTTKKATTKKTKKAPAKTPARRKKTPTPEAKEKLLVKELKNKALVEPKLLPTTAWTVYNVEYAQSNKGRNDQMKESSEGYKNLSAAEREHYNHLANENKATNEKAYKAWVESHTPEQIHTANNARKLLRRKHTAATKTENAEDRKGRMHPKHTTSIVDDRIPKFPGSAYSFFFTERYASGDFKGIALIEAAKLVGQEWKALSAGERKKYEDLRVQEQTRYAREYKQAFGRDPGYLSASASASPAP